MSDEKELDLDPIEKRAAAAIDGPWEAHYQVIVSETRRYIAEVSFGATATVAFIAHAREDVPALIAEVRRLREKLEKEREAQPSRKEWIRP